MHPQKKAKVFFSTHYHELTEIARFDGVKNYCIAIKENKGKPIFLRKVVEGKASKSYGIHVAEMAGMEGSIITRAQDILFQLERGTFFKTKNVKSDSPGLFVSEDTDQEAKNTLFDTLTQIDPNALSPLEALRLIYELKNIR